VTRSLAILAASVLAGSPGFEGDKYHPTTLRKVVDAHQSRAAGRDLVFATDACLVHVVYTGKKRPVPPERVFFLEQWLRSVGAKRDFLRLFEQELLFREGSREFWLPTQATRVASLEKEVAPGSPLDLFAVWAGVFRGDFVFLVNEFDAGPRRGP
jgi:hypothetical protein